MSPQCQPSYNPALQHRAVIWGQIRLSTWAESAKTPQLPQSYYRQVVAVR